MREVIDCPSPNCDTRGSHIVDMLVLHYTGMKDGPSALSRLCDPEAQVSSHYLVEEDGTVYRLVDEEDRAWHAGKSEWRGKLDVNARSIGIEIVNPGHEWGYRPFTEEQMKSVIGVCHEILARHAIEPRNVVAHSDIAPLRKEDPGELFDWKRLAREGIGCWPAIELTNSHYLFGPGSCGKEIKQLQDYLHYYGYSIKVNGHYDRHMEAVVMAFRRHFVPKHITSSWDNIADTALASLLAQI